MSVSTKALTSAITELSMLRLFPGDAATRAAIMGLLGRMVSNESQLQWLTRTMVDQVGEWPGPKELRGVFCSRFKPADGIETDCAATVGFTPNELAMPALSAHEDVMLLSDAPDPGICELVRTSVRRMPK